MIVEQIRTPNGAPVHAPKVGQAYLDTYLQPFRALLDRPDVTEIMVNQPGEVWVEGDGGMTRVELPDVDDVLLSRLAQQVARISSQGVNRVDPLLSAMLPGGQRIQIVAPPATRKHWVMSIRRHRLRQMTLDEFGHRLLKAEAPLAPLDPLADPVAYLRLAVKARKTILISGGTSSGKTTFLNALLREVPAHERVILVEDTAEINLHAENSVGLIAVKGKTGEAQVSTDDLLQASLRMRPDRIVLGELRGVEAVSFLRAINTGHPGSFSTIHANSPAAALKQLALMVLQSGLGLSRDHIIDYARSVIDIVVQLDRKDGQRGISAIADTQSMNFN